METSLEYYFIAIPVLLGVLLLILRTLTKNPWIKKRLSLSIFLLFSVFLLEVAVYYIFPEFEDQADELEFFIIGLAIITAAVVLLFNRFQGRSVSDKFPSIVQDAIIIAVFALAVGYKAPDKLLTTGAVGALVIGLALQDTLGNLFAGLALQVEKPFFVGDWVRLGPLEGRVKEVTWRATKIRTKAGEFCVIPNTVISKDTLTNYSTPSPILRMDKVIGFGYEAAPNQVKRVVLDTLADVPEILDRPAPDVLLETYNDFSIDYRCRYWIDDFGRSEPIMDKFTTLLYYRLQREGLRIPFPIRDVRMKQATAAQETADEELKRKSQFVERVDLFHPLDEELKKQIADRLYRITYAADETIIRQGAPGDSMFFIDSGTVRVVLEKDGAMNQLAVLEPGQYFGEMALLTGEARTATALAITDVEAYVLRKHSFKQILLDHPECAEELSRIMAERQANLDRKSEEVAASKLDQVETEKSFLDKIQNFFGL